jgi:hypothetical protein
MIILKILQTFAFYLAEAKLGNQQETKYNLRA